MARLDRQGKRAAKSARTRQRILDAARRQLRRGGPLAAEAVARAAGVTRVTIYNQFGTKAALLEAVFRDLGSSLRFDRALAALAHPDPRQAVATLILEQCRGWERERPALRRLVALAGIDPDVGRALAFFESLRHRDARLLAARLIAADALAADVTREEAAAVIVTLTSFQAYDRLAETGLGPRAVARALERLSAAIMPP